MRKDGGCVSPDDGALSTQYPVLSTQAPPSASPSPVPGQPHHEPLAATLMLVAATLFWGLSFPLMKHWQLAARDCPGGELVASHTLMGLRMLLGLAVLGLVRPGLFVRPTRRELGLGAALGLLNFAGMTFQMLGLTRTTPALSGFFTSLASAWVPLLVFACFRTAVARPVLWGLLLGLGGAAVLGVDPQQEWMIGGGEALTLLST